jgi:hypothetical protein
LPGRAIAALLRHLLPETLSMPAVFSTGMRSMWLLQKTMPLYSQLLRLLHGVLLLSEAFPRLMPAARRPLFHLRQKAQRMYGFERFRQNRNGSCLGSPGRSQRHHRKQRGITRPDSLLAQLGTKTAESRAGDSERIPRTRLNLLAFVRPYAYNESSTGSTPSLDYAE